MHGVIARSAATKQSPHPAEDAFVAWWSKPLARVGDGFAAFGGSP
jgi:hypothetical protein